MSLKDEDYESVGFSGWHRGGIGHRCLIVLRAREPGSSQEGSRHEREERVRRACIDAMWG